MITILVVYGIATLAMNYRPIADDYSQIEIASRLGLFDYANWVRTNIDPSPLGFIFYTIIFKIIVLSNIQLIGCVIFFEILLSFGFLFKVFSLLNVSTTKLRYSKKLFLIICLTNLIVLVSTNESTTHIKSAMSLTWISSHFLHAMNFYAFILLILYNFGNPNPRFKKQSRFCALVCGITGGIDPLISFLAFIFLIIYSAKGTNFFSQIRGALRKCYLEIVLFMCGIIYILFSAGLKVRTDTQVSQVENTGAFAQRMLGILALVIRENIVTNAGAFLLVYLLGLLCAASGFLQVHISFDKMKISYLVFGIVIQSLLYSVAESGSYFGYWHHGITSIVLGLLFLTIGVKQGSNARIPKSRELRLASTSILTLSLLAASLTLNNANHYSAQSAFEWDTVDRDNLSACTTLTFKEAYSFSNFLTGSNPKWLEYNCRIVKERKPLPRFKMGFEPLNNPFGSVSGYIANSYDAFLISQVKGALEKKALIGQLY